MSGVIISGVTGMCVVSGIIFCGVTGMSVVCQGKLSVARERCLWYVRDNCPCRNRDNYRDVSGINASSARGKGVVCQG